MSQNTPQNPTGGRYDSEDNDRRDQRDRDPNAPDGGSNPYYGSQQGAPPDLDAGAPLLRSADMQRLNRKALLFLVGIVALLIFAVFWMLRVASSDDDTQPTRPREEAVVIPALPQTSSDPVAEAPPPVDVMPYASPELPPLPESGTDSMPPGFPGYAGPPAPSQPSLLERRMMNGGDGSQASGTGSAQDPYVQAMLAGLPGNEANAQQAQAAPAAPSSAQFISRPDTLLVRGTFIRCVLETRIITDVPGFTSCIVTEPIYSINGRRLLLPKGSKVLGSYDVEPTGPRIAVIWDRITTPNGIDVSMASPGVDNLGSAGHPGKYNAHWGSRITSALLISLLSDAFKYAAAEEGPPTTTVGSGGVVVQTPYESTTARTIERLANDALDRNGRRPPTVTINQGTVVNVYVAKDVDFSGVVARF